MKYVLRSICVALLVFAAFVVTALIVESKTASVSVAPTQLRVHAEDLDGKPVVGAKVCACGVSVVTDVTGDATIVVSEPTNRYVASANWCAADVVVVKDGFVPTVVVGCVYYVEQTRKLTVRMYQRDDSELPMVTYVESPPADYLKNLIDDALTK